jgi:hypothetical protein
MVHVFNRQVSSPSSSALARPEFRARARTKADLLFTASMLMLVAALWIATRPYYGVIHDARLYVAEALRALQPERFADDLYFRFGSQDQFTIFAPLFAPAVSILGISLAAMSFTVVGQLLWLAALWYAVTALFRDAERRWFALAAAIVLPASYIVFLRYGEPFVTPRLFAEAMSLFAIGLLLRGRSLAAWVVLAVALAVHPLTALPGFGFAFVYLALRQPWWWVVAGAGLAIVACLSFAGVQPFANVLKTYDPEWFAIVKVRNSQCLMLSWPAADYFKTFGAIGMAAFAWMVAPSNERRTLSSALIVGVGGLLCTFVGGDLAANVFVVEIQPWRAMWLLILLANVYAVPAWFWARDKEGKIGLAKDAFAIGVGLLVLSQLMAQVVLPGAALVVLASVIAVWQLVAGRPFRIAGKILPLLVIAIACVVAVLFMYLIVINGAVDFWPKEKFGPGLYSFGVAIVALGLMAWAIRSEVSAIPKRVVLSAVSAILVLVAVIGWDARTPWTKFVDSSEPVPATLSSILPAGDSVFWESGLEMLWLKMRRPSYFSCDQGTGALFFRATALEYERLRQSFWRLGTRDFGQFFQCPGATEVVDPDATSLDLMAVCTREPALDDVVLTRPVDGVDSEVWDSPVPYEDISTVDGKRTLFQTRRFYVYSCAGFR